MMDKLMRVSGLAGAAGSLVLMAAMLGGMAGNGDRGVGVSLNAAGMLLLLVSLVSLCVVSRRMPLGLGWLGLVAATGGVIITLVSIAGEIVALLGGRGFEGMWPLFVAGMVCVLLGMSLYAASAAWAGLAPAWSTLTLVLGGAGTASMVLIMTAVPDAVQRAVGESARMASGVMSLVFLAGWVVYGVALVIGKVSFPTLEQRKALGWARRVPAVLLLGLVAAGGIAWAALTIFAGSTRVSADVPTPLPAVTVRTTDPSARPVVIDTDMAPDDWLAILYLLQREDLNVKAITVTGTGVSHCEPGTRHARGLLALAGYPSIPVACGSETPLGSGHSFPEEWRKGADTLQGLALPEGGSVNPKLRAHFLLSSLADRNRGKLTVVALGPLTNVAEAIEADPQFVERLAGVFIMGGAVDVPGNLSASEPGVAEWNIYADPRAASIVIGSGAQVTLVPLDATNHVRVTPSFVTKLGEQRSTAVAHFAYELLTSNREFVESGDYYFWDPLAAAIFTDESLASFQVTGLRVVEDGAESGRTLRTEEGAQVRVAVSADGARFERVFLESLRGTLGAR